MAIVLYSSFINTTIIMIIIIIIIIMIIIMIIIIIIMIIVIIKKPLRHLRGTSPGRRVRLGNPFFSSTVLALPVTMFYFCISRPSKFSSILVYNMFCSQFDTNLAPVPWTIYQSNLLKLQA